VFDMNFFDALNNAANQNSGLLTLAGLSQASSITESQRQMLATCVEGATNRLVECEQAFKKLASVSAAGLEVFQAIRTRLTSPNFPRA
jgi:hypothetical protein